MNKEIERARSRFNETVEVTVKVSPAYLDAIKRLVFAEFEVEVAKEKDLDRKPATKAFKTISQYQGDKLNEFLIKDAVGRIAGHYFDKQLTKYTTKKTWKTWLIQVKNFFEYKRWRRVSEKDQEKFFGGSEN